MHYIEINNCLEEGLEALSNFERWSKHEDMSIYTDVLEEWDDKISDESGLEDKTLKPVEWVDVSSNDNDKNELKGLLEKSFEETTQFVYNIYEQYLVMLWENEQIDYDLFVHEQLSDPSESIQYSLEHLIYQKELVTKELPFLLDKQILRVNAYPLKNLLEPKPNEILNKIYLSIPPEIKNRTTHLLKYLADSIRSLKASTTNVSDFVKQMKSLKAIDKRLPRIKEKIGFVGQTIQILEQMKGHIQGLDKDASKTWKSYQTQLLQDMINLENAMSRAEEGSEKNMIRFAEQVSKHLIPTLNKEVTKLTNLVEDKKFLKMETEVPAAIKDL